MSPSQTTWLIIGAAIVGVAIGASGFAIAQGGAGSQLGMPAYMKSESQAALPVLGNNEGVFVDKATFKLRIGKSKNDTAAQLAKMDAKEVAQGAIIVRSGNKLYIVDGAPSE